MNASHHQPVTELSLRTAASAQSERDAIPGRESGYDSTVKTKIAVENKRFGLEEHVDLEGSARDGDGATDNGLEQ